VNAKSINATAELIAGSLLLDCETAMPMIEAAGGIPSQIAYTGDAELVFRTAENLKRSGGPVTTLALREGCGLPADRVDRLADAAPLVATVCGLVARLREHVAVGLAGAILRDEKSSIADRLARINERLGPLADRGGDTVQIVDAGAYIESEPPAHDPIIDQLFEAGDKVGVIASAKRKKTWFTKQLALCVASGRPFLGWRVPKPRRVLIVQFEIKAGHYHRRMRYMAGALGITAAELGGRLGIVNGRGLGLDADMLGPLVRRHKAEMIVVDPLFKVLCGDENKAVDVKPVLAAFDRIATETGAAVLWVHHDSKGSPGDRDARDRGAGSNVLIRDVDQLFTMTPHRDDPELTVLDTLTRNYADGGPRTIAWRDGCFVESDAVPVAKTSAKVSQYSSRLKELDRGEPGLSLSAAASRLGCDRSTVSRLRKSWGVA